MRKLAAIIAVWVLALGLALPAPAEEPISWTGRVVSIIDGDSLLVRKNGKWVKVRLSQVDCPEPKQPFGKQAKSFTAKMAMGKTVQVENATVDPYYKKRMKANIILPDGRDLGLELVKEGLAWNYKRYSTNPLAPDLEKDARKNKLGLWSDPNPVAPWEWRKSRKKKR